MMMHYCDIFTDCFHCPVPFCPYEKLDDWVAADTAEEMRIIEGEEDEDEGW